jgi:hypothetical protein
MMIRRLALSLLFIGLLGVSVPIGRANEKRLGYCQLQATGTRVTNCTVTVYITNTVSLATIYSDNLGTSLANPFTASAVTGLWQFYSANGRYDIQFSGGSPTISPAYTLSDFLFLDLGTSGQSQSIAGDLLPAITNAGNVGNSSFIWGSGYFRSLTVTNSTTLQGTYTTTAAGTHSGVETFNTNAIVANAGITSAGANTLNGGGTTAGSWTHAGAHTFSALLTANFGITSTGSSALSGGGLLAGTFTGTPTLSGLWTFSGGINVSAITSGSSTPALSGLIRLASSDAECFRNNINTADICISKNVSDQLTFNSIGLSGTVIAGTSTMVLGSISGATCATAVTTSAAGTQVSDSIEWSYATAPSLTTDALLTVTSYTTLGNVNFTRCNSTAGAIVGTAIVINWRVIR